MKTTDSKENLAPSQLITNQIAELADWRGSMLTHLRDLIHKAAPDLREEWKWDTAVWSQNGNVVSTCAFKDHVKLNFFKGALLVDPQGLFNGGLDAKVTRSIDFRADDDLREFALRKLICEAVAYDLAGGRKK
ncbi:MAG TPA: DUF1801 domain-containing protein [Anaerolineales bacterium]